MQPASMLGVGPVQGSSFLNNSQVGGGGGLPRGLDQQQPSQLHQQSEQQVPSQPKMDDFLEQMFSLPSWSEMGGMGRAPWDFNAGGSANAMSMDAAGGLSGPQKMFTMSLMPSTGSHGLSSQTREVQDSMSQPHNNEAVQYSFDDSLIAARLQQHRGLQDALLGSTGASSVGQPQIDGRAPTLSQGIQEAAHNSLRRISEGSSRAPGLTRSLSVGSSGSDVSGCQQLSSGTQSPPSVAPVWRHSYIGGVLSLPLGVGQPKAETLLPQEGTSNDTHLLGKRPRDDEGRAGPQESLFNTFGGAQVGQAQSVRPAGQQSHQQQMQVAHGVSVPPYASHTGLGQPQGAAAVVAGTARPRVRARRGQATDPHSIAERLRRERIAERMKALQELVPNSNKTDKASMLDEIIEYVRFLQLQVKVLSMSRLGGASAVAPLVADLPAEGHNNFVATALGRSTVTSGPSQDGMASAERQVARLMEEDMGSAMQYLQTKGLCLMPISLATAISSTNSRPSTGSQGGVPGRVDASSSPTVASSSNALSTGVVLPTGCGDVVADEATTPGVNGVRNCKDSIQANGVGSGQPSSAVKNGVKANEETAKTRSMTL